MGECTHCGGTGRCQDDFHSGSTLLGETDKAGQDHRSILNPMGLVFGECPSCGNSNGEWRPECPHCYGSGDDDGTPTSRKKSYWGGNESKKERGFREREAASAIRDQGETKVGGGFWEDIGEKAGAIGGGVGALAGLASALEGGYSFGWTIAYTIIGAMIGGALGNFLTRFFPFIVLLFAIAGILKACS